MGQEIQCSNLATLTAESFLEADVLQQERLCVSLFERKKSKNMFGDNYLTLRLSTTYCV
jgi:hypothetical protein